MANTEHPRRKAWIAYALWFLLGIFGAHRFYLKHAIAPKMLGLGVVALILSNFAPGDPTVAIALSIAVGAYGLWVLSQVIHIGRWVREFNGERADPDMISLR